METEPLLHVYAPYIEPSTWEQEELNRQLTIQINFNPFYLGYNEDPDSILSKLRSDYRIDVNGAKTYRNEVSGSILYVQVREASCLPPEFTTSFHKPVSLGHRGHQQLTMEPLYLGNPRVRVTVENVPRDIPWGVLKDKLTELLTLTNNQEPLATPIRMRREAYHRQDQVVFIAPLKDTNVPHYVTLTYAAKTAKGRDMKRQSLLQFKIKGRKTPCLSCGSTDHRYKHRNCPRKNSVPEQPIWMSALQRRQEIEDHVPRENFPDVQPERQQQNPQREHSDATQDNQVPPQDSDPDSDSDDEERKRAPSAPTQDDQDVWHRVGRRRKYTRRGHDTPPPASPRPPIPPPKRQASSGDTPTSSRRRRMSAGDAVPTGHRTASGSQMEHQILDTPTGSTGIGRLRVLNRGRGRASHASSGPAVHNKYQPLATDQEEDSMAWDFQQHDLLGRSQDQHNDLREHFEQPQEDSRLAGALRGLRGAAGSMRLDFSQTSLSCGQTNFAEPDGRDREDDPFEGFFSQGPNANLEDWPHLSKNPCKTGHPIFYPNVPIPSSLDTTSGPTHPSKSTNPAPPPQPDPSSRSPSPSNEPPPYPTPPQPSDQALTPSQQPISPTPLPDEESEPPTLPGKQEPPPAPNLPETQVIEVSSEENSEATTTTSPGTTHTQGSEVSVTGNPPTPTKEALPEVDLSIGSNQEKNVNGNLSEEDTDSGSTD